MPPKPEVQGVLNGKAFFHVLVQPSAWRDIFSQFAGDELSRQIPDWWHVGLVDEPLGVTNKVGEMGVRHWIVIATSDPAWWLDIVEDMDGEKESSIVLPGGRP